MMTIGQLFDLTGKVALVTGGSRGLGLQMAEALGQAGARLAIAARKPHELEAASAQLRGQGFEVFAVPSNLGERPEHAAEALADAVLGHYGAVDILINNAGTTWGAPAETHPAEAWRKVMSLNVDACFFLAQQIARRSMIPRKSGKIVNIASIAGLRGGRADSDIFTVAYNTSKGAIINFTRALAVEWGKYNINVNAICPGLFPSKMGDALMHHAEAVIRATPLHRIGGEDDLKGVVVFLASEASRHITGHSIPVDGGVTAT
jgi:NAD(P)-dependent dehydrogenase (short-subunit alcohol dehydrogenase family)